MMTSHLQEREECLGIGEGRMRCESHEQSSAPLLNPEGTRLNTHKSIPKSVDQMLPSECMPSHPPPASLA